MSNAVSGIGTKFRRLVDSQYEDIAENLNIKGPSKKRNTTDVTNLDSVDGYQEFIPGLRDGGTVSFDANFTRAGYEALDADFESDEMGQYQIILPDAEHTSLAFFGFVVDLNLDIPAGSQIKCSVSIKVSGRPTLDSGSSAPSA
jgi:predicted secreted protein